MPLSGTSTVTHWHCYYHWHWHWHCPWQSRHATGKCPFPCLESCTGVPVVVLLVRVGLGIRCIDGRRVVHPVSPTGVTVMPWSARAAEGDPSLYAAAVVGALFDLSGVPIGFRRPLAEVTGASAVLAARQCQARCLCATNVPLAVRGGAA